MANTWKCVHGRDACRTCSHNEENLRRPEQPTDETGRQMYGVVASQQIQELERDVRGGDAPVLSTTDWLVVDGLMPPGQITFNDVQSAKHHLARKLADAEA